MGNSRFGVDIGGTFTDLIHWDGDTGRITVGKGASTPSSPELGVLDAVTAAMSAEQIAAADYFLHGATVGINALLERKGATVGIVATEGFRDVLEIRRGDRGRAMYELLWKSPPPLVPRHHRLGVPERILTDGTVLTPLDHQRVSEIAEFFIGEQIEAVAVALMNAHANPTHELAVEELLRRAGFTGTVSLSHQITGEMREYERTSTTVVDAYVRPRVSQYLQALEINLQSKGFAGSALITRSGGGAFSFAEAARRPFETVMSGPVAGAVGSGVLCRELELPLAVTADVGGTSFDACLILDGHPVVRYEGEVEGMPLQAPWVDVRSIGAGGGSIARFDGGLLRVGPESSGAQPGPVCYRRGGTSATVTDAAASLGMLGHGRLAGGFELDLAGAGRTIAVLAQEMDRTQDEAAAGILAVANANMADTVRTIMTEIGEDPRQATVLAFGGAGPLFGCLLARELGATSVVIPNYAGNFSAWSLLLQDVSSSAARTYIARLDAPGLRGAEQIAQQLKKQMGEREDGRIGGDARSELLLDLRYTGQEYSISVPVSTAESDIQTDVQAIRTQFENAYERAYGVRLDTPVQIAAVRLTLRRRLPSLPVRASTGPSGSVQAQDEDVIDAYSFADAGRVPFRIVDRSALGIGVAVDHGPLIITEETTTTYVDADFSVTVHPTGTMILTKES